MMHGADEEIDGGGRGEGEDQGTVGGPDPFAFEADKDVELAGVFLAEAQGFGDVGVVVGVGVVDFLVGCYLTDC